MNQDRIIGDLQEERKNIKAQLKGLEADLEAVDRLLRRLSSSGNQLGLNIEVSGSISLKPLAAAKFIFDQSPSKTWTPIKLRDKLVEMRKKGKLVSKTADLLPVSHRLLKSLEDQAYIKIIKKGHYKKT